MGEKDHAKGEILTGRPELSLEKAVQLVEEYMKSAKLRERYFIRSIIYQSTREAPAVWQFTLSPHKNQRAYPLRITISMDGVLQLVKD